MLGVLEVVEYSLKERFNMKYLHHVSYLVCVYHTINCISRTTCVLVVVQYTAVYQVERVYLS